MVLPESDDRKSTAGQFAFGIALAAAVAGLIAFGIAIAPRFTDDQESAGGEPPDDTQETTTSTVDEPGTTSTTQPTTTTQPSSTSTDESTTTPPSSSSTSTSTTAPPAASVGTCSFTLLAGELLPGHTSTIQCASGARLEVSAPNGYGNDARDGATETDRNKASASTGDAGITVEIRDPSGGQPLVISPSRQPGCFGQYITAAGYPDVYALIDTAEVVSFEDDGVAKDFVAYEDCTELDGDGSGDELTILYRP